MVQLLFFTVHSTADSGQVRPESNRRYDRTDRGRARPAAAQRGLVTSDWSRDRRPVLGNLPAPSRRVCNKGRL